VSSTQPDLTVEWWRQAYGRSFAVGTVLFGFVLVYQMARANQGQGHDFMEDTAPWIVGYFFGVFVGPPLAQMMLNGFGALSAGIIDKWGGVTPESGFQGINDALVAIVTQRGSAQAVAAIILSLGMIAAAFAIFISLCLQAMIQYLASAVFAIGFVFVLSKRHRAGAFKIPALFIGICASQPLMFFMMGIGFSIIKTALFGDAGDIGRFIATLVMAIMIFFICAFAPVVLLKFAPIVPTGTAESSNSGGGGGDVPRSSAAKGARSGDGSDDSGGKGGSRGGGSQTSAASRKKGSAATGGGGSTGTTGGTPAGSAAGNPAASATRGAAAAAAGRGTSGGPSGGSTGNSAGPGGGASSGAAAATSSGGGQSRRGGAVGSAVGGAASTAVSKLAAMQPAATKIAAGVSTVTDAAARRRRAAHNITKASNGDQPWS
jgi:hypothetical protein